MVNEDDELIHRRSKSYGTLDDTAALETASYTAKMHVEVNSLQRVRDSTIYYQNGPLYMHHILGVGNYW